MRIRPLEAGDIDTVLAIQSVCPEAAQWTLWDYERVARGEMAGWVAESANEIRGFLIAHLVASDVEILNLAVHPQGRRSRMGTALLQALLGWAVAMKAERAFLEVRESNRPALEFYERHGFHQSGRRKRYYANPIEDALLLERAIADKSA